MRPLTQVITCTLLTLTLAVSQRNSDEGQPYEFGFTIDGEQHRHEKKDENGIVQGEFGFITADGVYHVTVYATDENGNFKILSMRNIRISAPLDGSPATGPISPEAEKYLGKQKQLNTNIPAATTTIQQPVISTLSPAQLPQQPFQGAQPSQTITEKPTIYKFTTQPTIKPACSGCGYVTTPKQFTFQNPVFNKPSQEVSQFPNADILQQPETASPSTNIHQTSQSHTNLPFIGTQNDPYQNIYNQQQNLQVNQESNVLAQITTQSNQNIKSQIQQQNFPAPQDLSQNVQDQTAPQFSNSEIPPSPGSGQFQGVNQVQADFGFVDQRHQISGENGGTQLPQNANTIIQPNIPVKPKQDVSNLPPVTVSDNTIHVGGSNPINIAIKDRYPGMVDGLPDGIEEKDITDLLYKFHYTVGFHGHYEKGLKNGAKVGGYFVNGRDGISRVVTYIADENGYRPKFKFINLGLDSPDTPKEGSEKKFGLKSFEFIWYPIR